MKNQLFALIGLGLLLATSSAYAQTSVVKANVPFNFIVNKTELPAGTYTVETLGLQGVAIRNSDRTVVQIVLPNTCESVQASETSKLIFHRYGTQYFLAQMWKEGNERGMEMPRSGREQEVAMSSPAQNVVVVATLR